MKLSAHGVAEGLLWAHVKVYYPISPGPYRPTYTSVKPSVRVVKRVKTVNY